MASAGGFVRRALRTKVVLDHTQEMTEEEIKLRESALVFTVSGSCPPLTLGHISDGLLVSFPDLEGGTPPCTLLASSSSARKVAFVDQGFISECCGPAYTEFLFSPAAGTRGGIIVAWNPDLLDISLPTIRASFIAASCRWRAMGVQFNLLSVYGPQLVPDKLQFLEDLRQHCPSSSPALLVGDFNLILKASDKNTNNYNRRTMAAFRRFTNDLELEDLYLHGRRYTWSNEQADAIKIMAVHPPVWFIKRIGKAARGFLWANKDVATGGQCLISWRQVCSPKAYGGLGIPDLAARSVALRCRWLWQSWMDDNKPWVGLPLPIDDKVKALFEASVQIAIGDGEATQFWTDQWRPEGKLCVLFSDLFKLCTLRRITVRKALDQDKWIRHFMADLTPVAIRQDVRALVVDRARLPVSLIPNVHTGLQDWLISSSHRVGSANTKMWRSIVPLVWWCIWKERNERIFRHTASSPAELFQTLLSEAQLWVDAGQRRILALAEGLREPD
ncbi:hypothetical protein ACQ4PT_017550 [Festuca glaucescens]